MLLVLFSVFACFGDRFVLFSPSGCLDDIYSGLDLLGESCSFGLSYVHLVYFSYFTLWFSGRDFGYDCISALLLIIFYVLVICFNLSMLSFL